jgi:hypothetical protein
MGSAAMLKDRFGCSFQIKIAPLYSIPDANALKLRRTMERVQRIATGAMDGNFIAAIIAVHVATNAINDMPIVPAPLPIARTCSSVTIQASTVNATIAVRAGAASRSESGTLSGGASAFHVKRCISTSEKNAFEFACWNWNAPDPLQPAFTFLLSFGFGCHRHHSGVLKPALGGNREYFHSQTLGDADRLEPRGTLNFI